jgi:hypothetical protein
MIFGRNLLNLLEVQKKQPHDNSQIFPYEINMLFVFKELIEKNVLSVAM